MEKYLHQTNKIDETNILRNLKLSRNGQNYRLAVESIGRTRRYSVINLTKEEFKRLITDGVKEL